MLAWDDLKYVLALSRHGTATAAAKVLGVNGTTVTRRISALEEQLGTRLFDRQPHGMVATDAGEAAVQVALRIEREIHGLDAEVRGLDRTLRGSLRVASMDMLFELWRQDLGRFRADYPGVELTLSSSPRAVDLSRREADVAIRFSSGPPEQLVGRRFVETLYAVYVSDALAARVAADPSPRPGYSAYPWIGWDQPWEAATDKVIARYASQAQVPVRINSMGTLTRCMEDGLGVSVLPCLIGDRRPRLSRLGPYFEGGTHLWALTHEQLRRTARVRALMEFVAELVERDGELIMGKEPSRPVVPLHDDDS